jgi:hypothetical protein
VALLANIRLGRTVISAPKSHSSFFIQNVTDEEKSYTRLSHGETTFSKMTLSKMTLSIKTFSITSLCHYAECHRAECPVLFIVMLMPLF